MGRAETAVTQGALLPLQPSLPRRREQADLMHIYAGREMVLCCLPSEKINKISPKSRAFPSVNLESSGEEKHVCAQL